MTTPQTEAYNKPYQTTVAIDTRHIGDDNDYSCFLAKAILELYKAGNKETAYTLALTDPMLCTELSMEDFEAWMSQRVSIEKERAEMYDHYERAYSRD